MRDIQLDYFRKIGMKIGNDCYIFSDKIETTEPYLISIGNNVTIANDVKFATHDASANFYLEGVSDIYGRIIIGNHCFIGMGSLILPGVSIADNTIIAAGSVVTQSIHEPGYVYGGNPAKKIGAIAELKAKHSEKKLMTWGMSFEEKREYLLNHENLFKQC